MSENIEKRNPESGGLFWACADYLISLHPQCACTCKTLGSHLNWTILTNERIIVVLTMERCRLWSIGQCFNGGGHFKKLTLFATSSKASKYSAFPLTPCPKGKFLPRLLITIQLASSMWLEIYSKPCYESSHGFNRTMSIITLNHNHDPRPDWNSTIGIKVMIHGYESCYDSRYE